MRRSSVALIVLLAANAPVRAEGPVNAEFFEKRSDDSVVTVLTKGKNEDMKSFKDKLSHDQMVAVAAYIRSFATKS